MLMVQMLKTIWAFGPGAGVPRQGTRYDIVAIVFLLSIFDP